MRSAFVNTLKELARKDERIFLVTADMGFSVFESFREEFPNRFLNTGIAEQNTIGIAAGLAMSGKIVYVYSIIPFVTMRCFEQIRLDLAYNNANVKLVGVGAGFTYGSMGSSHHAIEDISIMRSIPNMTVFCPGDPFETEEIISFQLSKIILRNIFSIHKLHNGSLFSEYELIGISNYMFRKTKQKAIFTLRRDLDGKLSNSQILIARIFNVKHVTYEHTYPNLNSKGMLGRKQQWHKFIKILFKEFVKFNLRNLRHNFNYYYKYSSK
jgi:hypothetical protein